MSLTRAQAIDEMLAILQTAWVTTAGQDGARMHYENVASVSTPPSGQDAWGRVVLRHTQSRQVSLCGVLGERRFQRNGTLVVQVFKPTGSGVAEDSGIDTIVAGGFEGVTSPGGVEFKGVTVNEIGQDGDFYQVNVVVPFEYDEVK